MNKLLTITKCFISTYWIYFFLFLCAIAYEQSSLQNRHQFLFLSHQLKNVQESTKQAKENNKQLHAIVLSQKDPRWIDLTLRQKLGMSAENEKTFFFQDP